MFPHEPTWRPRHGPSDANINALEDEQDVPKATRESSGLTVPRQSAVDETSVTSDYPPLQDDLNADSQAATRPQPPPRRPGAGRKAKGLRINNPNPPPVGTEPDPESDHVTIFPDGSVRGQPKHVWAWLKGVGLCANKNCRQQLDDPYHASCAKCRAADNIKAKRYQAKRRAARAAAAAAATATAQPVMLPPQQHDHVLGHSRVEKQTREPFKLPPLLRDELVRLESQQQQEGEDDDGGHYDRIREELYQIVLGRAETSIAEIRAKPQNAVSQDDLIQTVNLRTLDDLTAVRLATHGPVRHDANIQLQEEAVSVVAEEEEAFGLLGDFFYDQAAGQLFTCFSQSLQTETNCLLSSQSTTTFRNSSHNHHGWKTTTTTTEKNLTDFSSLPSQTGTTIGRNENNSNMTRNKKMNMMESTSLDPRLFESLDYTANILEAPIHPLYRRTHTVEGYDFTNPNLGGSQTHPEPATINPLFLSIQHSASGIIPTNSGNRQYAISTFAPMEVGPPTARDINPPSSIRLKPFTPAEPKPNNDNLNHAATPTSNLNHRPVPVPVDPSIRPSDKHFYEQNPDLPEELITSLLHLRDQIYDKDGDTEMVETLIPAVHYDLTQIQTHTETRAPTRTGTSFQTQKKARQLQETTKRQKQQQNGFTWQRMMMGSRKRSMSGNRGKEGGEWRRREKVMGSLTARKETGSKIAVECMPPSIIAEGINQR
ncbi:hypothetical protein QBC38DRAFT_449188 [Podospora fimiseda]|uniref:Uncharacterized protein n=1 Tax=Podospora fimiseda TaxID=252190 RepID=A0AAN7BGI1_9PEZI|nr:hypothetical protein QBC38DRAFT_449188 [Podospora fimiseda]